MVEASTSSVAQTPGPRYPRRRAEIMDMKFEVAVISVSDVDRARDFYRGLGWRLDWYVNYMVSGQDASV